jgi:hypothetical protein
MPQSQIIDEVIGPGLINPSDPCHTNAFIEILFQIPPLRSMILAWRNRDPTVSRVCLLFLAMSQHQLLDAASLSALYKSDLLDPKDHSEFVL